MNGAPAVEATDVVKTYGDAAAVGPVDLRIELGTRVVLLGHNGSGKTTLLRIVAGLLQPTSGTVTVMGQAAGSLAARSAASYLGDQPSFYDDLSLREHLEYIARLHDTTDWEDRATDLVDLLGLGDRADELPTTFSRGLRQKAAIALAFVRPFDVLLVDEPFVGLDLAGRQALLELFVRSHAAGAALLVATHELATVAAAERIVALRDGLVVFDGPTAEADVDRLVTR
ncbi:MAG: ABC transporter ATP-binding protein [Acidimicrobiia bacterium]|nr:ABC transporter ATP-binding protein [Acidimicrobiia bacterium]